MRPIEAFDWAVERTLEAEGVFSDHAWDSGGATRYGITEAVARRHGLDVRELTTTQARDIYRSDYWDALSLDRVAGISWRVAMEIFDSAVNAGPGTATRFAQEALSMIFGKPVAVDGRMGPLTLAALLQVIPKYERHLVAALNGFQFEHYLGLLRRGAPAAAHAIRGWMLRLETPYPPARVGSPHHLHPGGTPGLGQPDGHPPA